MNMIADTVEGLDHLDIIVPDLDDAYARLQRLGFTVAAPSSSGAARTSAIAFPGIYLAFSDCKNPSALSEPMRSHMQIPGVAGTLLRTANIESAIADATARGVTVSPFFEFGRPVETASGMDEVRFRVAWMTPPEGEASGSRLFGLIQHLRPDIIWNMQTERHANGASGVSFVFSRVDSLAPVQRGLGRLLGEAQPGDGADILTFDAATARRSFALPSTFEARFPGLDKSVDTVVGIRVKSDIGGKLENSGLRVQRVQSGLMLPDYLPSLALVLSPAA